MAVKIESTQLPLAGMPEPLYLQARPVTFGLQPGQGVMYLGRVDGGPKFGARGVVVETRGHKVVVDLGRGGIWHIPYYYLAIPIADAA
jgi:hypothetical protein